MKTTIRPRLVLLLCVAIGVACTDDSGIVGPAADAAALEVPVAALRRWRPADQQTVATLRRIEPIRREYATSRTIGPAGGEIVIRKAGFRIVVPAGALAERTTITVTALAGRDVAYAFAPHGLQFAEPAIVVQDLRGTTAVWSAAVRETLQAAYFADPSTAFGTDDGLAIVTERGPVLLAADGRSATFVIEHFSGYLVASGYKDPAKPVSR